MRIIGNGLLLLFVGLAGCGGPPPEAEIRGQVTLNGEPLDSGTITFIPQGGRPPVTTDIIRGRYDARTIRGRLLVKISAPVVTGQRRENDDPHAPWVDIILERLPEHYNTASNIMFDAKAGVNNKDWKLEINLEKK